MIAELHVISMVDGVKFGLPIDQFTELAYEGLISGKDQIVIGAVGPVDAFNKIVDERRKAFEGLAKMWRHEA